MDIEQQFFLGEVGLARFPEVLPQVKHPLIVTRGTVKERYLSSVVSAFKLQDYEVFSGFEPCPTLAQVQSCSLDVVSKCDALIAIGGGSAMDCAKAIKHEMLEHLKASGADAATLEQWGALPLVTVATTFGSGSEVTPFAVIYTEKGKISLSSPELTPNVCFSVAEFGLSVPQSQRAAAACDCLCQGIEAYWATQGNEYSGALALTCIKQCVNFMRAAVLEQDLGAQEVMAQASLLSGRAISISRTTAAHALSYYFTQYHGIAHGHAVALIMRSLFALNYAAIENGRMLLLTLGLHSSAEFKPWLEQLMRDPGLRSSFADFSLPESELAKPLATVNLQRLANNPAPLTAEQLRSLLC